MIDFAKQLVAIDSSPIFGTSKVCQKIYEDAVKHSNISASLQSSEHRGKDNQNIILKTNSRKNKKGLLLVAHLDTPDPGVHGLWDKNGGNPFELTIHGNTCFGLGVVSKFNFLSMYLTLTQLSEDQTNFPVTLVGTHSEEDGLIGIREFMDLSEDEYVGAIVAHPTDLNLLNEGLGISVVEIKIPFSEEEQSYLRKYNEQDNSFSQSKVFRGKSAHSSNPNLGESAINKMFDFLKNMPGVLVTSIDGGVLDNTVPEHSILEFITMGSLQNTVAEKLLLIYNELKEIEEKFKKFPHNNYESVFSTLNIGKIRTYKDAIVISVSCRLLPSVPEKTYRNWILDLKNKCTENGLNLKFKKHFPSFFQSIDDPWAELVNDIHQKLLFKKTGSSACMSCSEASILTKNNIKPLLFGAGVGAGNSHQPNESISMVNVKKASQFYKLLISK